MIPAETSQSEKAALRDLESSVPFDFRDPERSLHLRHSVVALLAGVEKGEPGGTLRFIASRSRNAQSVIRTFSNLVPNWALRERQGDLLHFGLMALAATSVGDDPRDTMISLTPYYIVAEQLGLVPSELFSQTARHFQGPQRTLLDSFGQRRDITLKVFGFRINQSGDGPEIVWEG